MEFTYTYEVNHNCKSHRKSAAKKDIILIGIGVKRKKPKPLCETGKGLPKKKAAAVAIPLPTKAKTLKSPNPMKIGQPICSPT